MSLYDQLSEKAAKWSKRYFDNLKECQWFGKDIATRYATYLQAPQGKFRFIKLTPALTFDDEQRELTNLPWMQRGKNGKHYFGINVHWESGQYGSWDRFQLGLRKLSAAWEVEWDDKRFEIPFDDLSKLDALFAALVKASTNVYDAPTTESASTIGFIPTTSA